MSNISYDGLWRLNLSGKITLPDGTEQELLLRAIGRDDAKARRDFAREQANLARLKLLDTDSEEYRFYLARVYTSSDEELEKIVRQWYGQVLSNEAKGEIILVEDGDDVEPPSTLVESLEKEEQEVEQAEFVEEERQKYVDANIENRIANTIKDRDKMIKLVVRVLTESYCLDVYNSAWEDATLYYGVLKPDGTRFFEEMPVNSPEQLVAVLRAMYREVDEGSYRPSS